MSILYDSSGEDRFAFRVVVVVHSEMQSKRSTANYNALARHHSLLDSCLEGLEEVNVEAKKGFPTVRDSVAPALEAIRKHKEARLGHNEAENGATRENEISILRENSHIISRPYTILWRQKKTPKPLLTRTLTHLQPLIASAALQPEDTFDVFTSIQKRVGSHRATRRSDLVGMNNGLTCCHRCRFQREIPTRRLSFFN